MTDNSPTSAQAGAELTAIEPGRIAAYLRKMRGTTRGAPPRVSNAEIIWSWIGGFLGILAVALVNRQFFDGVDLSLMIGSEQVHALGFYYAIVPVGLGSMILLLVSLIVNNIPAERRYPEFR